MNRSASYGIIVTLVVMVWAAQSCSYYPLDTDVPAGVYVSYSRESIIVTDSGANSALNSGLVLYPGGLVDAAAYITIASEIASRGIPVVIARFTSNLAVTNPDAALTLVRDSGLASRWVIAGHSLGGAMAADCLYRNPGFFEGLVLLASYPPEAADLSGRDTPVLSLAGGNDMIAAVSDIQDSFDRLPPVTIAASPQPDFTLDGGPASIFHIIEGGNHAGFGNYGPQAGDGTAEITTERQWEITADYIEHFFREAGL